MESRTPKHCNEVFLDLEESREVQTQRIEYFKRTGDQHFTKNGLLAEITNDLVLHIRARMSQIKVNGPEDAVVNEMIEQLPREKIYGITEDFQELFVVKVEAPISWKIVKPVFLRIPDGEPKNRIRSYRAIAFDIGDVQVVRIVYCSLCGKRT